MSEIVFDDRARAFCEIVAQLIISDAAITDSERHFLERLMDRFGLDDVGKKAVIDSVDIGEPIAPRLERLDRDERRALLAELEAAAAVDGEIAPGETEIIEEVRRALGE